MALKTLDYSCFSLSLRTGSIIIAVLCMFGAFTPWYYVGIVNINQPITIAVYLSCLISSLVAILFVVFGIWQEQTWAVRLFTLWMLIKVFETIMCAILFLFQRGPHYFIIGAVPEIILNLYCLVVVYSFLKQDIEYEYGAN